MGCCCCSLEKYDTSSVTKEYEGKGLIVKRQCKDVIFLIFFMVFWMGMFWICHKAFKEGNLNRLIYGYDSYGFLCGVDNKNFSSTESGPDLTHKKRLYYLNAMELLNPLNIKKAKSICVESCPSSIDICTLGDFCTSNNQFRCPYYRIAEDNLYNNLTNVEKWNTNYFSDLTNLTSIDEDLCPLSSYSDLLSALNLDVNCGSYYQAKSMYPDQGPCYPVYTDTVEYFNRCFPNFSDEIQEIIINNLATATESDSNSFINFSAMTEEFGDISERIQRYAADITKGWIIITVAGLISSVILSLLWMIILRYFAGLMSWALIIILNVLFMAFTILASERSGILGKVGEFGHIIAEQIPLNQDPTEDERRIWLYIAIGSSILSVIFFLLTLVMIPRIKVAVALLKVASQAISTMPLLLLFPLLPFIFEVILVFYFVFITALLYSSGNLIPKELTESSVTVPNFNSELSLSFPNDGDLILDSDRFDVPDSITREECALSNNCYYGVEWNKNMIYMFLYHLFGLLWTSQFIIGFSYVVIAGATANYYWSSGDRDKRPIAPVISSLSRTLSFHLGSIAFGSFIIALIQFIRLILEFINRKCKKLQEKGGAIIKHAFCCLQVFLCIFEKILKFINRNAYIMVAVKGTNYCQSATRAVTLLISNALRLAAVNIIGDILIFIGKITVTLGCGVIAFLLSNLDYYKNEQEFPESYLSSPLMPILLSLLIGYIVSDLFFGVYEMTVDTLLLSFCEDCESHGGVPLYAPMILMNAVGNAKRNLKK